MGTHAVRAPHGAIASNSCHLAYRLHFLLANFVCVETDLCGDPGFELQPYAQTTRAGGKLNRQISEELSLGMMRLMLLLLLHIDMIRLQQATERTCGLRVQQLRLALQVLQTVTAVRHSMSQ